MRGVPKANRIGVGQGVSARRGRGVVMRLARGLTLVEMLLALAITGMIGVAIASMLSAVAYGTSESRDIRSLVVKNKTLGARVSASIRQAAQVLDLDDGYVVLWINDTNGSGVPDLQELQRIELDDDADQLASYTPDPDTEDVAYAIDDDFDTITTDLIDSGDMIETLWATGVSQWVVDCDTDDPADAALVSFQITLTSGTLTDTSVHAVSLRD